MRITFVLPFAGLSGGTKVIAIYADRLKRRGHEVFVVSTPYGRQPLRHRLKSLILRGKWPVSRPGLSHFDGVDVPHRVLDRWRPVTDDDVPDADVIVATWWMTGEWVWAMSPSKGAKAILIQGYEVLPGEENPALDAVWRLPLHKIVVSRWLADLARDEFGDGDVSHVPNSVDLAQFKAPPRGRQAQPTVGLLYATNGFKECRTSLAAFQLAERPMKDLQLVSFGSVHPGSEVPLPSGVDFAYRPPQQEIRRIYSRCDVWLCGCRRDGFHLPLLEAMACRCPVVSTRMGAAPELIEEGINGYMVDVGDVEALADRLQRVLALPEDRWRAMSDAAYATATRYTWDDATMLLEKALERAIAKSRSGVSDAGRSMDYRKACT